MKLGPKQKKWIAELRHGGHRQARSALFNGEGYCCLGVAARFVLEIVPTEKGSVYEFDDQATVLSHSMAYELGLRSTAGVSLPEHDTDYTTALTELNDDGCSFDEIADLLERDPRNWFKESK